MPTAISGQEKSQPFPYFFHEDRIDYQRCCQMLRSIAGILPPFAEDVLRFIADASVRFGRTHARITAKAFTVGYNGSTDGFGGTIPPAPHSEKTRYTTLALLERLGLIARDGQVIHLRLNNINPVDLLNDDEIRKGFMHRYKHNQQLRTLEGVATWAAQRLYSILRMISGMGYSPVDGNSNASQTTPLCAKRTKISRSQTLSGNASKTTQTVTHFSQQTTKTSRGSHGNREGYSEQGTFLSMISSILQANEDLPYSFLSIIDITYSDKSEYKWGSEILGKIMANRTPQEIATSALASVDSKRQKVRQKQAKRGTLADRMRAFEREWGAGQIEASGGRIPSRIDQRGKKLVKDQIIKRATDGFDTTHFAYWVSKNWQAIGAQFFTKAKSYPEKPVVPWLIKCLETYLDAYEAREHLDETGTISKLSAKKAIAQRDKAYDNVRDVVTAKDKEIELLKAQLNERDDMLDEYEKGGKLENPDLSPAMRKALRKAKKVKGRFKDFDDE